MAAKLENPVLDTGLNELDANTDRIMICESEPTTYALATTGHLGLKSFGAGACFSSPTDGTAPTGRKVISMAVTDGTILTTGTASWWGAVTTAALLAHGAITAPQAVTATNTFTLGTFEIKVANA